MKTNINSKIKRPVTGFTLIEIMLVLAIIALLAGTAIFKLGGVLKTGEQTRIKEDIKAIEIAGYYPGRDIYIALDVAASELFREGKYHFKSDNKSLTSNQVIEYYQSLINKYPIISIEDGLDENDWVGWQAMNKKIGSKVQIVGDDLTVTNKERLQRAIDQKCINSILIKPNQIGTLTETIDAVNLAKRNGFSTVISHRSGETEDNVIADLAVALNAGQIKTGSMSRSDRMSKYNQLLRIEEQLSDKAFYPKKEAFTF